MGDRLPSSYAKVRVCYDQLTPARICRGGTKVEVWTPQSAFAKCNRSADANGAMYNAMILPYAAGPMALAGFTW